MKKLNKAVDRLTEFFNCLNSPVLINEWDVVRKVLIGNRDTSKKCSYAERNSDYVAALRVVAEFEKKHACHSRNGIATVREFCEQRLNA